MVVIDWDHPERVSRTRARVCVCVARGALAGGHTWSPRGFTAWFCHLLRTLSKWLKSWKSCSGVKGMLVTGEKV